MRYTVELEEDPNTKELLMTIPTDILSQMGWHEGTELFWVIENDNIILKEKYNEPSNSK